MSVNPGYTASYAYNTAGLRVSKSVTQDSVTTTTLFLTDGGNVMLETNAGGTQTAFDVYSSGGIISRTTSTSTLYYIYNGHGDVVQLTNSSGNVIITYKYDALGNMTTGASNDTNPFRYCGEYFDTETETYYLRARYYNPSTGRFTQRDSFGGWYNDPLSLNRYTYCHNNPLKYIEEIETLHPLIRSSAAEFIIAAQAKGMYLRITSGHRTFEEQDELYAQGRTKPGAIVTNAKGGYSNHNYGLAFDVVEIKNSKALWDGDWNAIGELGKSFGFEWGGEWSSFPDRPHFQMLFDYEVSDLRSLYLNGYVKDGYVIIDPSRIRI